ncbi:MAG: hypothetical protein VW405_17740 [Rhodospirillaceae bacterium]
MAINDTEPHILTLVWRRRVLVMLLEAPFIRTVLLAGLSRPVRWVAMEDGTDLPLLGDVLVCSFGDPGPYLRDLRARGFANIGAFHFGDETGADATGY